jgi:hypothetical protein
MLIPSEDGITRAGQLLAICARNPSITAHRIIRNAIYGTRKNRMLPTSLRTIPVRLIMSQCSADTRNHFSMIPLSHPFATKTRMHFKTTSGHEACEKILDNRTSAAVLYAG